MMMAFSAADVDEGGGRSWGGQMRNERARPGAGYEQEGRSTWGWGRWWLRRRIKLWVVMRLKVENRETEHYLDLLQTTDEVELLLWVTTRLDRAQEFSFYCSDPNRLVRRTAEIYEIFFNVQRKEQGDLLKPRERLTGRFIRDYSLRSHYCPRSVNDLYVVRVWLGHQWVWLLRS